MRRFSPGSEPVMFAADTANDILDGVTLAFRQQFRQRQGVTGAPRNQSELEVRNETGDALAACHIVGLGDPLILPADNPQIIHEESKRKADTPTIADHCGNFAVMTSPADIDGFGTAAWRGEVWANIELSEASDKIRRCDVIDGDVEKLQPHIGGAAEILWKPDEIGVQACLIDVQGMRDAFVWGTAEGDIIANTGGQVAVANAGSSGGYIIDVEFSYLTDEGDISDGKTVGVLWVAALKEFHPILAECET